MAAFDEPFGALPERPLELDRAALPPLDEAADERRLDALAVLFGLLRELDALLRELDPLLRELDALLRELDPLLRELAALLPEFDALLPFEDVLRVLLRDALLFGLDPFELREVVFLLLCDFELVWAITPP